VPRKRHEPYEQAVYINGVDWTSTHAFDVSIYVFSSSNKAQMDRKNLITYQGRFPTTNRWRQVGPVLFVGSADTGGGLQCTIVDNKPKCPALPRVPAAEFLKLVSIASP
jgi:hypothetical protein